MWFSAFRVRNGYPSSVSKSSAKPGKVSAEDEVILVAPAKAGGAFFKVGR